MKRSLVYLNAAEDARCSPTVGVTSQTTDAAVADAAVECQLRDISVTSPR